MTADDDNQKRVLLLPRKYGPTGHRQQPCLGKNRHRCPTADSVNHHLDPSVPSCAAGTCPGLRNSDGRPSGWTDCKGSPPGSDKTPCQPDELWRRSNGLAGKRMGNSRHGVIHPDRWPGNNSRQTVALRTARGPATALPLCVTAMPALVRPPDGQKNNGRISQAPPSLIRPLLPSVPWCAPPPCRTATAPLDGVSNETNRPAARHCAPPGDNTSLLASCPLLLESLPNRHFSPHPAVKRACQTF